jgi:hypothetical protein
MTPFVWTLIQVAMTVAPAAEAIARRWQTRGDAPVRDEAAEREALQHAWQAFEFQARQRTLTLASFIIGLAVLVVAYTLALMEDLAVLAAVVAASGVVAVLFFNRFDALNRTYLHAAERALSRLEERLAAAAAAPDIILAPGRAGGLYQDALILMLQVFGFVGFAVAFIYALTKA